MPTLPTQNHRRESRPNQSNYGCPPSWILRTRTQSVQEVLSRVRRYSGLLSLKTPSMIFVKYDAFTTDLSLSTRSSWQVKDRRPKQNPRLSCRQFKTVSPSVLNTIVWLTMHSFTWTRKETGGPFISLSLKAITEVQERSQMRCWVLMANTLPCGSGARVQQLSPLTRSTRTCVWNGHSVSLVQTVGRRKQFFCRRR